MMTNPIIVHSKAGLEEYREAIQGNLDKCIKQLQLLMQERDSIEIFQVLKFEKSISEPLSGKPENLIEVINQSMTYLVSIMAVEYLFDRYPKQIFTMNLGKLPGYDIESMDGEIIAECFAATSYRSNQKLAKDLGNLERDDKASWKYEFFYDKYFREEHQVYYRKKYPKIQIVKFSKMR